MGQSNRKGISRRAFLKGAASAFAFSIAPSGIFGTLAPSNKLHIAGVGVGGMGRAYLQNVAGENITALCDVDENFAAKTYKTYPKAKTYNDFRKMLDTEKGIDAVVIGTPDHTHATVAMRAMRMGKHVYCAKPLTRTVYEARLLAKTAEEMKVQTQMSVQSDASEEQRLLREMIDDGAVGKVREVHIWSNRPIWPQGVRRPEDTPPVPAGMNWDLFLGPAPTRPYHPCYHPFKWRGWFDFGTGALGDMGCHAFDHVFKMLKLKHPGSVSAETTTRYDETYPKASTVRFDFNTPDGDAVKLLWYDGGRKPQRPEELDEGRDLRFQGMIIIGSEAKIFAGFTGGGARLIPEKKMKAYKRPPKTLPRSTGHYREWIAACKGGKPAGCNFQFGGPLTEAVLLGNIAVRTGRKLKWDGPRMKITNDVEANEYIHAPYRDGWTL